LRPEAIQETASFVLIQPQAVSAKPENQNARLKTKKTAGVKRQTVIVKDLKTRKNHKGGLLPAVIALKSGNS